MSQARKQELEEIELIVVAHVTGQPKADKMSNVISYPAANPLLQTLAQLIKDES